MGWFVFLVPTDGLVLIKSLNLIPDGKLLVSRLVESKDGSFDTLTDGLVLNESFSVRPDDKTEGSCDGNKLGSFDRRSDGKSDTNKLG